MSSSSEQPEIPSESLRVDILANYIAEMSNYKSIWKDELHSYKADCEVFEDKKNIDSLFEEQEKKVFDRLKITVDCGECKRINEDDIKEILKQTATYRLELLKKSCQKIKERQLEFQHWCLTQKQNLAKDLASVILKELSKI